MIGQNRQNAKCFRRGLSRAGFLFALPLEYSKKLMYYRVYYYNNSFET